METVPVSETREAARPGKAYVHVRGYE